MDEIDRERVEAMTATIMASIRENYVRGPHSRDRVFEALNALSFAAATVIAGTGDMAGRIQATVFFGNALAMNVAELVRDPPGPRH